MLLALDTSTRTAGIALYDGIQVLSEYIWTSKNNQSVADIQAMEFEIRVTFQPI